MGQGEQYTFLLTNLQSNFLQKNDPFLNVFWDHCLFEKLFGTLDQCILFDEFDW